MRPNAPPYPSPGVIRYRCRCGLLVLRDDARKTISHEAPECAAGGEAIRSVEVLPVDDDD